MPWFRSDDRLTTHTKYLRLPSTLKCEAMGLWIQAGTWSSLNRRDGFVPADIIGHFGTDCDTADVLVTAGFWREVPEGYEFVDWNDYQPSRLELDEKRAADAERKRRSRANQGGGHTDVTPDESGHVRGHTLSALPDPSRPEEKKSGRKRPATPIPDDWKPSEKHRVKAIDRGVDVEHEAEQMRNWALGKDERKVDWDATFHNWLGNARPRLRGVASGQAAGGRAWQE